MQCPNCGGEKNYAMQKPHRNEKYDVRERQCEECGCQFKTKEQITMVMIPGTIIGSLKKKYISLEEFLKKLNDGFFNKNGNSNQ